MATLELTDAEWLSQDTDRVEGVLRRALGNSENKAEKDESELIDIVEYALGKGFYTGPDLLTIRAEPVSRGIMEIV